jgi:hypothetical protein
VAWSSASLGEVKLPPHGESQDELYLYPHMRVQGDRLDTLDGVLRRAMEASLREIATEAVEFTMDSLWSRVPGIPLEEVLLGVVTSYEAKVRGQVHHLAVDVIASFVPETGDDPAVGGGEDSATAKVGSISGR